MLKPEVTIKSGNLFVAIHIYDKSSFFRTSSEDSLNPVIPDGDTGPKTCTLEVQRNGKMAWLQSEKVRSAFKKHVPAMLSTGKDSRQGSAKEKYIPPRL